MNASTYDSKCYDLADDFLFDHPCINSEKNCAELAAVLQETIDEFIAYKLDNYDGPDDPPHLKNATFCDND